MLQQKHYTILQIHIIVYGLFIYSEGKRSSRQWRDQNTKPSTVAEAHVFFCSLTQEKLMTPVSPT